MLIEYLQKNKFSRRIIYKGGKARVKDRVNRILPFLKTNDSIIDVGSGTCNISEILSERGYDITPLDIRDLSFVDHLSPVIYDGKKIPFDNDKFDKALILTVLHHTPNPEQILNEAIRVSNGIIIIEDIYSNWIHKYITYFFDSLFNLEFFGHPHTNKSDEQWKNTFVKFGLKLVDVHYNYSFGVFKHATYYLEK